MIQIEFLFLFILWFVILFPTVSLYLKGLILKEGEGRTYEKDEPDSDFEDDYASDEDDFIVPTWEECGLEDNNCIGNNKSRKTALEKKKIKRETKHYGMAGENLLKGKTEDSNMKEEHQNVPLHVDVPSIEAVIDYVPEEPEWMVFDPIKDCEYGLFTQSRMRRWHEDGQFDAETLVQNVTVHGDFCKLGDIFPRFDRAFQKKQK